MAGKRGIRETLGLLYPRRPSLREFRPRLTINLIRRLPPHLMGNLVRLGKSPMLRYLRELPPERKGLLLGGLHALGVGGTYYVSRPFLGEEGAKKVMGLALAGDLAYLGSRMWTWRYRAIYDPLTGLKRKEALEPWVDRQLAAVRRGKNFTIILADIDHFKVFNDHLGYPDGDWVLREFGNRAKKLLHSDDFLTHSLRDVNPQGVASGGDEFHIAGRFTPAQSRYIRQRLEGVVDQLRQEKLAELRKRIQDAVGEKKEELKAVRTVLLEKKMKLTTVATDLRPSDTFLSLTQRLSDMLHEERRNRGNHESRV